MGQGQVRHVDGEIVLAEPTTEARIETPLLAYTRDAQTAIIVRRVKQASVGQRENLVVDRPEHRARVTLLEIRPAGAPDQQAIAGKRHGLIVEHEADAAIRMTRCRAHRQMSSAEPAPVAMAQVAVRAFSAARSRYRHLTAPARLEHPRAAHVLGVYVGIGCIKRARATPVTHTLCPP